MTERIVRTRAEAAAAGEVRYYTGKPCRHGHDSERYTSTNGCIQCLRYVVVTRPPKCREQTNFNTLWPAQLVFPVEYAPTEAQKLIFHRWWDENRWNILGQVYGVECVRAIGEGILLKDMLAAGWTWERLFREGYARLAVDFAPPAVK